MAKMPKMRKQYFIVVNNKNVAVSYQVYQEIMHSVYKEEHQDRKFRATESLDFDIYGDEVSGTAIKLAMRKYEDEQYSEQLLNAIAQLYTAIEQLKPKEQELIMALFFCGETQSEYAKKLGVTQQYVSAQLKKILKKMKKLIKF